MRARGALLLLLLLLLLLPHPFLPPFSSKFVGGLGELGGGITDHPLVCNKNVLLCTPPTYNKGKNKEQQLIYISTSRK
jgi:hypothetical protein